MTWIIFMVIFTCFALMAIRLDFRKLLVLATVLSLILAIVGTGHEEKKSKGEEVNPSEMTEKEQVFERQQKKLE